MIRKKKRILLILFAISSFWKSLKSAENKNSKAYACVPQSLMYNKSMIENKYGILNALNE